METDGGAGTGVGSVTAVAWVPGSAARSFIAAHSNGQIHVYSVKDPEAAGGITSRFSLGLTSASGSGALGGKPAAPQQSFAACATGALGRGRYPFVQLAYYDW